MVVARVISPAPVVVVASLLEADVLAVAVVPLGFIPVDAGGCVFGIVVDELVALNMLIAHTSAHKHRVAMGLFKVSQSQQSQNYPRLRVWFPLFDLQRNAPLGYEQSSETSY